MVKVGAPVEPVDRSVGFGRAVGFGFGGVEDGEGSEAGRLRSGAARAAEIPVRETEQSKIAAQPTSADHLRAWRRLVMALLLGLSALDMASTISKECQIARCAPAALLHRDRLDRRAVPGTMQFVVLNLLLPVD